MKKERIFWGVFFILGAIFMLVSKMGAFSDINMFSLFLTVVFAATIIKSLIHFSFPGIFFSAAFISIIYAGPLGITAISPWPILGAALLASVGFSMIFKNRRNKYFYNYCKKEKENFDDFSTVENHPDSNQVSFITSFGAGVKYVNSDDFQRANLKCSFGGMKVYFDNAIVQGGSALINVNASFAGVELFIPKSWNIIEDINITLGGVDYKNRNNASGNINVTLTGDISFSGVTIIFV